MRNNDAALVGILLVIIIQGCGGGGSADKPSTPLPPIQPPAPAPSTDHSGLTPLSAQTILSAEYKSGGLATVFLANEDSFSQRPRPISEDFQLDGNFTGGDHTFRTPHTDAGPLLNSSNCQGCHLKDGRGMLPESVDLPFTSTLVKIGNAAGLPDPVYGDQIQTFAEQSFSTSNFSSGWPLYDGSLNGDLLFGEAHTQIEFEEVPGTYPDGASYSLRKPTYRVKDASFGPFVDGMRFSPRVSPQIFGAGLLEAIPAKNIRALADEDDTNNDSISGRVSMVTNIMTSVQEIGRFTYKAQTPSVLHQGAAAYLGDMGVTSSLFPTENCSPTQTACLVAAEREIKVDTRTDISDRELALVEFYNRVLGVPARRGYDDVNDIWEAPIASGRESFFNIGCIGCHTPRHVTGEASGSLLGEITLLGLEPNAEPIAMLSEQVIFPYTDLLLHDMGGSCEVSRETQSGTSCSTGEECHYVQRCEGLADGLPQGDASGSEWKTPPLWGLGLVKVVNARATFLHDGRARTIEEAILWHGGEAEDTKKMFMQISSQERADLLTFLGSL
jgi:CxxC motif-containing protein (DUF1111 family)